MFVVSDAARVFGPAFRSPARGFLIQTQKEMLGCVDSFGVKSKTGWRAPSRLLRQLEARMQMSS